MSQTKSDAAAPAKKDDKDAAPNVEAPKEAKGPSKYSVGKKLASYKRKLNSYTRVKDSVLSALKGEDDPAADAKDGDKKVPVSKVLEGYKLIRNFALTFNWLKLDYAERQEGMMVIPTEFEDELQDLLSKDIVAKFLEAMKGKVEDVVSNLPAEFDDAKVQKVTKFIDARDQVNIIDRLKKEIDELSAELTVLKAKKAAEPASPKSSKASKTKVRSVISDRDNSKAKNKEFNAEEQFQEMVQQIKKRIGGIRFLKDDYQVYSEVNGQIDLLLFDANYELHQIKKSLKKKFAAAQAAGAKKDTEKKTARRERRRAARSGDDKAPSNSVFSKNVEE